jgi:mono/diheme cytochrome c family protein
MVNLTNHNSFTISMVHCGKMVTFTFLLIINGDSDMKRVIRVVGFLLFVMVFTLVACRGSETSSDMGEKLFAQTTIGDQPGCITCHSLEPGVILIGPSVAGIASRAGSMVSGLSAEEYLKQSIVDPNAYLVPGYPQDTMPPVWRDRLSEKQVDDLVSYQMTLK